MAERRMFAKTIVLSDAFLDMPLGARCLYMTMGMLADDDGFVNAPKSIMRQCGASDDDLKVLISKKFVLPFESGVIVIKHWRINNYLQKDRIQPTKYVDEMAMLSIDENGAYTQQCIQNCVYIDKDSIDKNSIDNITVSNETVCCTSDVQRVIQQWNSLGLGQIRKVVSGTERERLLKKRIKDYGIDDVLRAIENVRTSKFLNGNNSKGWIITFDWFIKPNNFPKVLDGNYESDQQPQQKRKQYTTAAEYTAPKPNKTEMNNIIENLKKAGLYKE